MGQEEEKFLCRFCNSPTRLDTVKATFWLRRGLIAIEDIPARVCDGCGEQFFDDEVARKIEKIVEDPAAKAKREVLVPFYSLAE